MFLISDDDEFYDDDGFYEVFFQPQEKKKTLQEAYIEYDRKRSQKLRQQAAMEAEIQRRVNEILARMEPEDYTINIKSNVKVKK